MNLGSTLQQNGAIDSIARELGIDQQTARAGAGALLPAIVAGMGRSHTVQPAAGGGLGAILGGLAGGGAGGGLLDAVLGSGSTPVQPGNDILGSIFGSKDVSRGVAEEVGGATGIDPAILKKMLPILAMAVVGTMMNQGKAGGASGGGLGGGALGGILGSVLSGMTRG